MEETKRLTNAQMKKALARESEDYMTYVHSKLMPYISSADYRDYYRSMVDLFFISWSPKDKFDRVIQTDLFNKRREELGHDSVYSRIVSLGELYLYMYDQIHGSPLESMDWLADNKGATLKNMLDESKLHVFIREMNGESFRYYRDTMNFTNYMKLSNMTNTFYITEGRYGLLGVPRVIGERRMNIEGQIKQYKFVIEKNKTISAGMKWYLAKNNVDFGDGSFEFITRIGQE